MNSEKKIVIELLAHQELKKFQEFIKNHWKEEHLFAKDASIFDWQHKGPHAYYCMVAKQDGDLVGVQGFIPQSHFDKHLPGNQIFLTLWKVLEDRGLGIGLRLYKNILKEWAPEFIGSIGINRQAIPFHEWQGFKVGIMDHYITLSPYVEEFKIAKIPESPKLKAQNSPEGSQENKPSVSFQKITEKELEALETTGLYLHQWPIKSDTYIKNRFLNHPVYKYDLYAILKGSKVQALCVIRPIFKEGSVALRFVDFVGPNEAIPLLQDFAMKVLKAYNAEYLDLYSYGIPSALIEKAGFINRRKVKDLIIPNHFEPFERKNVDIIFGYKSSQTHPAVRLFKADGDQDRPSQIPRENKCRKN